MTSVKLELTKAMEKHFVSACEEYCKEVVTRLSRKYKFEAEEEMASLGIMTVQRVTGARKRSVKRERRVPGVALPYCGAGPEEWCEGIRLNHRLFTQCTMLKMVGGVYCKTCQNQSSKNGLPTYGTIQTRGTENWSSPQGKQPVNYGNVMVKLNIPRERAISEAAKFGWEIKSEQFESHAVKKGRPSKKSQSTSDTESEKSEKKKRGRPKKTKKVISNSAAGDDLIKTLIEAAAGESERMLLKDEAATVVAEEVASEKVKVVEANNAAMSTTPAPKPEKFADVFGEDDDAELKVSPLNSDESDDESDDESEAATEVAKFEFEGKTYLKDGDDCLYDIASQDHVGNFDPDTKTITLCEDE